MVCTGVCSAEAGMLAGVVMVTARSRLGLAIVSLPQALEVAAAGWDQAVQVIGGKLLGGKNWTYAP